MEKPLMDTSTTYSNLGNSWIFDAPTGKIKIWIKHIPRTVVHRKKSRNDSRKKKKGSK